MFSLNFFGKPLTGRNVDSAMMYIGKYLVQQEEVDTHFNLNNAILALQQNYGFVAHEFINTFSSECRNFYTLQKQRQPFEMNRNAFKKFKHDSKNGLTISEVSSQNTNELYKNIMTLAI